jgi:hypothetical protein
MPENKMTKQILQSLLAIWLVYVAPSRAQDLAHHPGAFYNIGYGARTMAMGGSGTALSDDAFGGLWNPAGLSRLAQPAAGFYYMRQFGLIPYLAATYVHPLQSSDWTHGEALLVSGDDALRETILAFSLAHRMDRYLEHLMLGATLRYKNATYGNNSDGGVGQIRGNAIGVSLDIGMQYLWQEHVVFGLACENMVDFVSWNSSAKGSYRQSGPPGLKAGIAFIRPGNWVVTTDMEKSLYSDTQNHVRIGIEKTLFSMLYVRGGLHTPLSTETALDYHCGLGISKTAFKQARVGMDMAYVMDEMENTLRFSLTLEF